VLVFQPSRGYQITRQFGRIRHRARL
jgi:hypothetical protein